MIRREKRLSRQNRVMFIERIERVRCLDTGKVGSGLICSEEMIGNAHISPNDKKRLGQVRHQLYGMIRATSKGKRRKILYKQSGGGIFAVLLPAIASVISSIIASRNTNG